MKTRSYIFILIISLMIISIISETTYAQRFGRGGFSRGGGFDRGGGNFDRGGGFGGDGMSGFDRGGMNGSRDGSFNNGNFNRGDINNSDINRDNFNNNDINRNVNNYYGHNNIYHNGAYGYAGYHPYAYHPYHPYAYGPTWYAPGAMLTTMYASAVMLNVANQSYYYNEGVFYEPVSGGYTVVNAPTGAEVTLLPSGYEATNIGSETYYY